jgi:hypothetical protein
VEEKFECTEGMTLRIIGLLHLEDDRDDGIFSIVNDVVRDYQCPFGKRA